MGECPYDDGGVSGGVPKGLDGPAAIGLRSVVMRSRNMNINLDFFQSEVGKNVYPQKKFHKVVLLGYEDEATAAAEIDAVSKYLKSPEVGVLMVEYFSVPAGDEEAIKSKLELIVAREQSSGNNCALELSGGDAVQLAAARAVAEHFCLSLAVK